jgi:hypothetical protein
MLLDDIITEIEKQQKDELTANESPVKIADTIRGLDAMKSALYRVSDKWKELGITHNLGHSIRL